MADHDDFETTDAGASLTYPKQAGELKKGDLIVMKEKFPCKIVSISTSKTGKHGHAKANITAIDIFTGKKYEDMCPTSHNMECPRVTRSSWDLQDINEQDNNMMTLYGSDDYSKEKTIPLPLTEEGTKLKEDFVKANAEGKTIQVNLLLAMDVEGTSIFLLIVFRLRQFFFSHQISFFRSQPGIDSWYRKLSFFFLINFFSCH